MQFFGWLFLMVGIILCLTIIGLVGRIPLIIVGELMIFWGRKLRKGNIQKKIAKLEYKIKYGKVKPEKAQRKIDKLKIKVAKYS